MIDQPQIKSLIADTINSMGKKYANPKAIDLVYNTGLVESKYKYIAQIKGPARGFFQCEPFVAVSLCNDYLQFRQKLLKKVAALCYLNESYFTDPSGDAWEDILKTNLIAQIIVCRLHYWRIPKPLPQTIEEQAVYWKNSYNTSLGKGTKEHFMEIVEKYG